jgi:hypothetical protein
MSGLTMMGTVFGRERRGVARMVEALSSHMWPHMSMKRRGAAQPNEDDDADDDDNHDDDDDAERAEQPATPSEFGGPRLRAWVRGGHVADGGALVYTHSVCAGDDRRGLRHRRRPRRL